MSLFRMIDTSYLRFMLQDYVANGVTNNIEDVITKSAVQEVVPNTRTELGKRKKGKKEKKENVIMAENVPGHMGQLSVEQLVHLIEGNHSEQNVKKQGQKDKSSSIVEVVSEETNQTKKERRRKSKELKENTQSTPPVVTIGAQQTKTGGPPAAATTTSSPPAASATAQPLKMEFTVANKRVTSPVSEKRRGKGAERNVRCSTEDCEEEFLSADEGVASPVGDEASTPPTVSTLTATTTTTTTASATSSASEVILDGRNYRADDEDVTQIERQCADEQEFITVNTKKKKVLEYTGKQQQRTGSAGKEERHQRVAERLEPARRSSLGMAPETRSTPLANSPLPSARRPTTASLADFLDDKVIDAAKMQTKSSVNIANVPKNVKKLHRNEMSKSASQNPTSDSPERTFSYADAAKKSSEPSRDNSPACVAVASPSGKSESPAPTTPAPVSRPVETSDTEVLPCANVSAGASGAADGLSFFYDETEAALEENQNEADNGATPEGAFVLNLGGKTVHFAKGMASSPVDAPPSNSHHMCMVEMLAQRWKMFQEGHVPQIYQPRIISS
uniref:Serine-rich adhesin for platelets n=1 Tax=Haemonchus contortus TaxID=6289 RepID=A0A7I4Y8W4_HAECO